MNRSLLNQASQLQGPQRASLVSYIGQLNGIPPQKASQDSCLVGSGQGGGGGTGDQQHVPRPGRHRPRRRRHRRRRERAEQRRPGTTGPVLRGVRRNAWPATRLPGRRSGPPAIRSPWSVSPARKSSPCPAAPVSTRPASTAGMMASSSTTTASMTINTAVIGNRFDVARTVRHALKESDRLNGKRRLRMTVSTFAFTARVRPIVQIGLGVAPVELAPPIGTWRPGTPPWTRGSAPTSHRPNSKAAGRTRTDRRPNGPADGAARSRRNSPVRRGTPTGPGSNPNCSTSPVT